MKDQPKVDGRVSVRKNSTIDFKSSYLNFNDAFYSAYTEQEYALILLTQAVVKSGGTCTVQGNLGIHQHNGALYVGCQNKDTTKNFCQVKLLGMDATSDFAFNSQLSNYIPKSRLRELSLEEMADKIHLHYNNAKDSWNNYILPVSTLAYWSGAFNAVETNNSDGSTTTDYHSSLRYCEQGRFGNVVTRDLAGVNNWKASPLYTLGTTKQVPSVETIAYWDGSYQIESNGWHSSNLMYCNVGKFATAIQHNIGYGSSTPSEGWKSDFGTLKEGDIYIQLS